MPLRVEKLFQEYNQPAAFAVASVLTLLALVTLGAKAMLEKKVRAVRGGQETSPPVPVSPGRGGVQGENLAAASTDVH
jgi:sulfate transport system permease protein